MLTSCALDHLTWENVEPAGTSVLNGVTVHRFPTASRRLIDYFTLDGRLRVAPERPPWPSRGDGSPSTVRCARAWSMRWPTTDADVVACYPVPVRHHGGRHRRVQGADGAPSRPPTTSPRIYLRAFRQSFRDIDGLVYHTRAERDLMEHVFTIGARPQIVLGLGVNDPAGAGRPGGTSSASATVRISATWAGSTSTRAA